MNAARRKFLGYFDIFRINKTDDTGFIICPVSIDDDFAGFDDLIELKPHRAGIIND